MMSTRTFHLLPASASLQTNRRWLAELDRFASHWMLDTRAWF
jgi:hypothetical protein